MQIDLKYKSTVVDLTQMSEQVLLLLKTILKVFILTMYGTYLKPHCNLGIVVWLWETVVLDKNHN